ncbi:hypothetical protein [Lactobacillus amylovorus]|jgi:hypothetical protein|uniref:hypothetical protein n=1 Tax=Lactobacillus amylovorus TaxID=1604 RepID=UPI003D045AC0|nr:hypothetical protein [Lactobacillus amylovorus]
MNTITPQQLFSDYKDILAKDTTGLVKLKVTIKKLNELFKRAEEKNSEKLYKIVASPIIGLDDNKEISDKEAFDTFVSHRQRTTEYLANKDGVMFDKLTLADMLIKDFTNAFELDKKLLVRLVAIDRMLNDKVDNMNDLYFQPAGRLITELNQSVNDWNFWVTLLDRRIRNSASHLDFYYDEKTSQFKGKETITVTNHGHKLKRINCFLISPKKFLNEILPNAINAAQSFWAAGILLCLEPHSEYYDQALEMLN